MPETSRDGFFANHLFATEAPIASVRWLGHTPTLIERFVARACDSTVRCVDFIALRVCCPRSISYPPHLYGNSQQTLESISVVRCLGQSLRESDRHENGGTKSYFKVTLSKTYRDGDEFKSTSSLSRDGPAAVLLLQASLGPPSWQRKLRMGKGEE